MRVLSTRLPLSIEAVCSLLVMGLAISLVVSQLADAAPGKFVGTTNDPQVHVVIDLHNPHLAPRQLAYDAPRDGLWFWSSTQKQGSPDNRIYFYDISQTQLRSWPLYAGDWSSQWLAGIALAPNGDVWVGWNRNLVAFHPSSGTWDRYIIPERPRFPLPAAIIGDRPTNLGIADLVVGSDGMVWIARDGALSLTAFVPTSQSFTEHPLPANGGDPLHLAMGPDGHVFFTTNLSADHPGYIAEKIGEYEPGTGTTYIYSQGGESLAVTPQGDLYSASIASARSGRGLVRLGAVERANARAEHRAPVFERGIVPVGIDDTALAADGQGRLWMALSGEPKLAVFDPATGRVQRYQYAAPSIAAHPARPIGGPRRVTPPPGAVWLRHMAVMVTDRQGHLWFIRAGSDKIEEVSA